MSEQSLRQWALYWGGPDADNAAIVETFMDLDEALADQQFKGGQLAWRDIITQPWQYEVLTNKEAE
jgi:hypothetical protein